MLLSSETSALPRTSRPEQNFTIQSVVQLLNLVIVARLWQKRLLMLEVNDSKRSALPRAARTGNKLQVQMVAQLLEVTLRMFGFEKGRLAML